MSDCCVYGGTKPREGASADNIGFIETNRGFLKATGDKYRKAPYLRGAEARSAHEAWAHRALHRELGIVLQYDDSSIRPSPTGAVARKALAEWTRGAQRANFKAALKALTASGIGQAALAQMEAANN